MFDAEVELLRAVGALRRDHDGMIREGSKLAAVSSAEGEHTHSLGARRFRRAQHVRRFPARRMNDEEITGSGECLDLSREDGVESEVIAGRGDQRRVGRQGDRGICGAVAYVANYVLRGEVLRVD